MAREDAALAEADGWLICDTSPLVTMFYSEAMFGRVDPELVELATRRYDHVLLCAPDFVFVQDGTRRDAAFRQRQDNWYREALRRSGEPFHVIAGTPVARVQDASRIISKV